MAARNTRFAFSLFGRLHVGQPDQNLFISPFGVSNALALAYYGAGGDTARAIADTMQWQGATPEQVSESLLSLRRDMQESNPRITLAIADSLWLGPGEQFRPEFTYGIGRLPATLVDTLDFSDPRSADTINAWVNEQTRGLIPTITSPGELHDILLLLLDVVYFKGPWQDTFEHGATQPAPFTLVSGKKKDVPLMDKWGRFSYVAAAEFQAVRLPYKASSLGMLVLLPAKTSSLQALVQSLTPARWEQLRGKMDDATGHLKLPRFSAQNTQLLDPALKALGMGSAFEQADFSAMCNEPAQLSMVRQKAVLKVDEEGAEAAAMTAVPGAPGEAAPPPPAPAPFEMIVDRPFFLAIEDGVTGTLLFMGAIVEPAE